MRVGFIGAGLMGAPMVERLIKAGHEVTVSSRTPDLLPPDWTVVDSPASAAADAEVVCSILPDSAEVRAVVAAVLHVAGPGTVLVEMTTHSPAVARELALEAESRGVAYLDCPAGGGVASVRDGTLAFWVGGPAEGLKRAWPVLAAIGDEAKLRHCGPVGTGLVVKLVNNYLVAVNAVASGEALAMVREAGVDPRTAIEAITSGGGGTNAQLANLYPNRVFAGDFRAGFRLGYMLKDLRHAFDLAADTAVPVPVGEAASARLAEAGQEFGDEVDFGSVARLYGW
ncbi:NAD(P)-dependent oxidoreductase [Actinacidiphila oryziradicis]|uniref:NAD(P)-dependent oxidoreductase n=1 Tax=Actinacidiphila oryziradicis TaxID=2571141 RepID=A0A4U0RVR5_9ACTN|nr:NAD(P)-dependent oxidoreductase [Actinacidiphila oryziradicis]TKA00300.1 NAD(P)-dependent oxidoreductase [Actinacidiphila oryziradicis]